LCIYSSLVFIPHSGGCLWYLHRIYLIMSAESRNPAERVADALDDDDLVPLGERKAQENGEGDAIYLPYPQPHARNQGLEQSAAVEVFLHASTGAVVLIPKDDE